MFATMEIVSYVMILVSAVFKGLALMNLSNKSREFAVSQKKYKQFNMISYLFLLPGVLLFVYSVILH